MTDRPTPFGLAFGALAGERFPEIAAALARGTTSSADRDAFVLVQPTGALLQDLIAPDAPPDAIDAYVRLLHHAYRHWTAGRWVYRVSDVVLARAASGGRRDRSPASFARTCSPASTPSSRCLPSSS